MRSVLGGLDTAFIEDTRTKRAAYVSHDGAKLTQVSARKQARSDFKLPLNGPFNH
jgi:hypothetical protein